MVWWCIKAKQTMVITIRLFEIEKTTKSCGMNSMMLLYLPLMRNKLLMKAMEEEQSKKDFFKYYIYNFTKKVNSAERKCW